MENTAFEQGRRKLAEWQRGPERMIAGVCASMARQLEIPLPLVRGLFLVAAVVPSTRSAALLLYLALWFLTPPESGEPSGLDRVVNAVSSFGFGARRSESSAGQSGSAYGADQGGYGAGGSAPYGAANGGAGGRIGAQRDGESEAGAGAAER
ncbi:MAG: PspC domain-containing protein [Deltaproteobacteria bacterium]|nr:PspC domain-containing protein [Deltaproteobacteria bacterium]